MRIQKTALWLALLGSLSFGSGAHAATLYTAPLFAVAHIVTAHVECKVMNVVGSPTTVRLRMIVDDGTAVADSGEITLAPFEAAELVPPFPGGLSYCRFDVRGGKKRVRAGACTMVQLPAPGAPQVCSAVLPAH